jgi:galactokinase
MIDYQALRDKYLSIFGAEPRVFRAPGRVNLIGEHTDYNGGFVLPMAIDRETSIAISKRNDRKIVVHTVNYDETAEFDLDKPFQGKKGFWLNYIEGVARILEDKGTRLNGSDIVIWSDVPTGAGLSSSAALETAAGLALTRSSGHSIDKTLLAQIGQQTEHEYVGANVGIMDQFVSANAQAGHALLLDCRSLEYENVPLDMSEAAVVIVDTNVKHDLATTAYNERRQQCEEAVRLLKQFIPNITQLRDVSVSEMEEFGDTLPDTIRRRARHVVTENDRTLRAADALRRNDLIGFGRLMWESHASLRDDYEVSCKELDTAVEIARKIHGVLGARMTGGGFGGSTVNLVRREVIDTFSNTMWREFETSTGIEPTILTAEASQGASEVLLEGKRSSGTS